MFLTVDSAASKTCAITRAARGTGRDRGRGGRATATTAAPQTKRYRPQQPPAPTSAASATGAIAPAASQSFALGMVVELWLRVVGIGVKVRATP